MLTNASAAALNLLRSGWSTSRDNSPANLINRCGKQGRWACAVLIRFRLNFDRVAAAGNGLEMLPLEALRLNAVEEFSGAVGAKLATNLERPGSGR